MDIWKKDDEVKWLPCPVCHQPKMLKYNKGTVLKSYPAYCKKCRRQIIVNFDARIIK